MTDLHHHGMLLDRLVCSGNRRVLLLLVWCIFTVIAFNMVTTVTVFSTSRAAANFGTTGGRGGGVDWEATDDDDDAGGDGDNNDNTDADPAMTRLMMQLSLEGVPWPSIVREAMASAGGTGSQPRQQQQRGGSNHRRGDRPANDDRHHEEDGMMSDLPIRTSHNYTSFRYVVNLKRCVPMKVSWSANRDLYEKHWKGLPVASAGGGNRDDLVVPAFNYTVIRDPLERLYSGYWNKCLHSPKHEQNCVGFPGVADPTVRTPPTLREFLEKNAGTGPTIGGASRVSGGRRGGMPAGRRGPTVVHRRRPFEALHGNSHFTPMSKLCHPLTSYQRVYDM
jgi:hypothetical protein